MRLGGRVLYDIGPLEACAASRVALSTGYTDPALNDLSQKVCVWNIRSLCLCSGLGANHEGNVARLGVRYSTAHLLRFD